jgi:death-on-curing protein
VDPLFLTLEEVLTIHHDRIRKYGGSGGVRDLGLLQLALGTVEATFGGALLHETLFEMAAAYLFHISRNHPFVDGNKRTGLACALAFLSLNGVRIESTENDLYELAIGVANGEVSKAQAAVFFQEHK